jgi:hypothetical protein
MYPLAAGFSLGYWWYVPIEELLFSSGLQVVTLTSSERLTQYKKPVIINCQVACVHSSCEAIFGQPSFFLPLNSSMPSFSLRLPQFRGRRHSRSRSPNPTPTTTPHSPGTDPSRVSSSHSSHGLDVPEQYIVDTPCPSAAVNPPKHQNTAGCILTSTAPDDFSVQPWRPVTPIGVVDSNSAPIHSPRSSVVHQPVHLPYPHLPSPQHQNPGMFNQAHNLSAMGNFIDGNVGSGRKYVLCVIGSSILIKSH